MSVVATELPKYKDKKVTIVRNLDKANDKGETAEELEGLLVAVAGSAVMFRPKGKTSALLIEVGAIESIDFAQERAKPLTRKTLKVVQHGQARAHLLERHGATLAGVNGMSETAAFELHEGIDHIESDLGHVHKDKDAADADTDAPEADESDD